LGTSGSNPIISHQRFISIDMDGVTMVKLCMSTSGKHVAFIILREADWRVTVHVWDTTSDTTTAIGSHFHPDDPYAIVQEPHYAHAQYVMWCTDPYSEEETLMVAYSTDFYDSDGAYLIDNEPEPSSFPTSKFWFVKYDKQLAVQRCTPIQRGRLLACSSNRIGNEILLLLLLQSGKSQHPFYSRTELRMFTFGRGLQLLGRFITSPLISIREGPLYAALSPTGDCIVVIPDSLPQHTVLVHVRNNEGHFSPCHEINVSSWIETSTAESFGATVRIEFSPCGRFFALVDRRAEFGDVTDGYGVVIVDMAMRGTTSTKSIRVYPLFESSDQSPRGFQWSSSGIWILPPGRNECGVIGPRGGGICLLIT
jgi:hypothetical protein